MASARLVTGICCTCCPMDALAFSTCPQIWMEYDQVRLFNSCLFLCFSWWLWSLFVPGCSHRHVLADIPMRWEEVKRLRGVLVSPSFATQYSFTCSRLSWLLWRVCFTRCAS